MVSHTSLALKTSRNEIMVWATDLQSGKPISGEKITIFNRGQKLRGEGETESNGVARINIADDNTDYYADYLVFGERDGDISFVHSSWSEGVAPWNFDISTEPVAPEYYMYLYTDRPIYRPGQEVFFKGIVRQEKDYKFKLPEVKKVKVMINDSDGNEIYNQGNILWAITGRLPGSLYWEPIYRPVIS